MKKEMKGTRNGKSPCSWTGKINIKMPKLPKVISLFNELSIKILMIFEQI
jgi:hypothetical protein